MTVEDWELEAYADGAADARLDRLIHESPQLARQVAQIRRDNAALRHALHRVDCPSVDDLRLYQSGFLPASRAAEVGQHIHECRTCASEVQAYAQLDADPQPALADALSQLKHGFEILLAQLLRPTTPLPALRGNEGNEGETQTMRYGVPGRDWQIDLIWATDELGYKLTGQLIASDGTVLTTALATLIRADVADNPPTHEATATTFTFEERLDEVGWFVFHDVELGRYALWLEIGEARIQIVNIGIGPA